MTIPRKRTRYEAIGCAVLVMFVVGGFSAVAPTVAAWTETPPPDETTTTVETTVPDDGDTTEPGDGDEGPDAGDTTESSDDDDGADTLTWLAVGASVVLVGAAAWWMARRVDDEAVGLRPMDDDWPGNSEVI